MPAGGWDSKGQPLGLCSHNGRAEVYLLLVILQQNFSAFFCFFLIALLFSLSFFFRFFFTKKTNKQKKNFLETFSANHCQRLLRPRGAAADAQGDAETWNRAAERAWAGARLSAERAAETLDANTAEDKSNLISIIPQAHRWAKTELNASSRRTDFF